MPRRNRQNSTARRTLGNPIELDAPGGLDGTPPDNFDLPDERLDILQNGTDTTDPSTQPTLDSEAAIRNPRSREKFEKERRKAAQAHQQALSDLRTDLIRDIDLGIRVQGREGLDYPFEGQHDDGSLYAGRNWPEVTYMWKAAANCHKPLYFEQPQLERYGPLLGAVRAAAGLGGSLLHAFASVALLHGHRAT